MHANLPRLISGEVKVSELGSKRAWDIWDR